MKYPESIDEVTVKHLQYPFTPEEFVKQIAPDKIQSPVIRPLYVSMLEKGLEKEGALKDSQGWIFTTLSRLKNIMWDTKWLRWTFICVFFIIGLPAVVIFAVPFVEPDWDLRKFLPNSVKVIAIILVTIIGPLVVLLPVLSWISKLFAKSSVPKYTFSEIRAQYAEKNLDVILSSRRGPHRLALVIYEDFDQFGDQARSASEGTQLMGKIKMIEDTDSLGYNLDVLFMNDKIRKDIFKEKHHYWALVAFWAFHEIIPGEGADWSRKKYYEDFAKVCFATHLYEYVKTHLGIESQTNHDFIDIYSNENGEFSTDKVEQLFAEIRSESQIANPIRKILSEINKKAS